MIEFLRRLRYPWRYPGAFEEVDYATGYRLLPGVMPPVTLQAMPDGSQVVRHYGSDGLLEDETWLYGGQTHRIDGPASRLFYPSGSVSYEKWSIGGRCSREDGPATTSWREDGSLEYLEWRRDGQVERLDGPAEVVVLAHRGRREEVFGALGVRARSLSAMASELLERPTVTAAELLSLVQRSVFAPLLAEGITARQVVESLAEGVSTVEGIRALREGTPAEWVRSFEAGVSS